MSWTNFVAAILQGYDGYYKEITFDYEKYKIYLTKFVEKMEKNRCLIINLSIIT